MNQISEKQFGEAEQQFKRFESMINSMTPQERSNPDLLAKVQSPPPPPLSLFLCLLTATSGPSDENGAMPCLCCMNLLTLQECQC